eukprot:TRINITY_DN4559_c0_g1_i1.p1 TRINITY_DN4559_c0_g1~~TRINITY_DN4559_c0_g1_i1.p1  ORF type:complete len:985 (-),score=327.54 TRINITY_DN4559_c0_g1_i1:66-3020(-)
MNMDLLDYIKQFKSNCFFNDSQTKKPISNLTLKSICEGNPNIPFFEIPPFAFQLAKNLGVTTEKNIEFCLKVMNTLCEKQDKSINTYCSWLLSLKSERNLNSLNEKLESIKKSFKNKELLYMSSSDKFVPISKIVLIENIQYSNLFFEDVESTKKALDVLSNYLDKSYTTVSINKNEYYLPYADLFKKLGCKVLDLNVLVEGCKLFFDDENNFYLEKGKKSWIKENSAQNYLLLLRLINKFLFNEVLQKINELDESEEEKRRRINDIQKRIDLEIETKLVDYDLRTKMLREYFTEKDLEKYMITCQTLKLLSNEGEVIKLNSGTERVYANMVTQLSTNKLDVVDHQIAFLCPVLICSLKISYLEEKIEVEIYNNHKQNPILELSLTKIFRKVIGDESLEVWNFSYMQNKFLFGEIRLNFDPNTVYMKYKNKVIMCLGFIHDEIDLLQERVALCLARLIQLKEKIQFQDAVNRSSSIFSREKVVLTDKNKIFEIKEINENSDNFLKDIVLPFEDNAIFVCQNQPWEIEEGEAFKMQIENNKGDKKGNKDEVISNNNNQKDKNSFSSDPFVSTPYEMAYNILNENSCDLKESLKREPPSSLNVLEESSTKKHPKKMDKQKIEKTGILAELYFFTKLCKFYPKVTHKNWISSNCLEVFKNLINHPTDDNAGYDFEFEDSKYLFVSKKDCEAIPLCRVEVKGCSSFFDNTFFMSRNEIKTAFDAQSSDGKIFYFVVIIENVLLNLKDISIRCKINWNNVFLFDKSKRTPGNLSANFVLKRVPETYKMLISEFLPKEMKKLCWFWALKGNCNSNSCNNNHKFEDYHFLNSNPKILEDLNKRGVCIRELKNMGCKDNRCEFSHSVSLRDFSLIEQSQFLGLKTKFCWRFAEEKCHHHDNKCYDSHFFEPHHLENSDVKRAAEINILSRYYYLCFYGINDQCTKRNCDPRIHISFFNELSEIEKKNFNNHKNFKNNFNNNNRKSFNFTKKN